MLLPTCAIVLAVSIGIGFFMYNSPGGPIVLVNLYRAAVHNPLYRRVIDKSLEIYCVLFHVVEHIVNVACIALCLHPLYSENMYFHI